MIEQFSQSVYDESVLEDPEVKTVDIPVPVRMYLNTTVELRHLTFQNIFNEAQKQAKEDVKSLMRHSRGVNINEWWIDEDDLTTIITDEEYHVVEEI